MNRLEYKGYYGSIEYSAEDSCLYGKVLGMPKDLISYEGNTASELYEDFKGAVDDYLELCENSRRYSTLFLNSLGSTLIALSLS